MLNNFTGNNDREITYKRTPDNSETKFRFDYETDPNTSEEIFLSNLYGSGIMTFFLAIVSYRL